MMRAKKVLPGLLLMGLLLVGAAAVAPFVPIAGLKGAAEARLSQMLGRRVSVESARLSLFGRPCLTLREMVVEEAPEFGGGVFMHAGEVRARFGIIEYLRTRQLSIDQITITSPAINLIKNAGGAWNWTTLGQTEKTAFDVHRPASAMLSLVLGSDLSNASIGRVKIETASVKMIDRSAGQSKEVLYNRIDLDARMIPIDGGKKIRGDLTVQSDEDGEAGQLSAALPLDVDIGGDRLRGLAVTGSIGPGPVESANMRIGSLMVTGDITARQASELTGKGRLTAEDLFIRTMNISERVARSLKLEQIGDMNPGTNVAKLETDFELSRGSVSTTGMRVQQLDGLGDATAQKGDFKIESDLVVHYDAAITLSAESTARVKSASPTLGLLVTVLESNNQLSLPITIDGDVRNPEIKVDVSRIL